MKTSTLIYVIILLVVAVLIGYSLGKNENNTHRMYYEYDVYKLHDTETGKLNGDSVVIPVDTIYKPF